MTKEGQVRKVLEEIVEVVSGLEYLNSQKRSYGIGRSSNIMY